MRTIGLFTAWACKDWINAAIKNHLRIVDELHVMIAPHNKDFKKLEDSSKEIAMTKWKDDPRVTFHNELPGNLKGCCDRSKCIILNQMREYSKPEVGDIIIILDSDEFYCDKAIAEIRAKFDGPKWDSLAFIARYFAINMKWYMLQSGLRRMFRVRSTDFHFKPTQNPVPKPKEHQVILANNPMFHYSLLMPIEYKLIHWGSEIGMSEWKLKWVNEIYAKWDPNNLKLCERLAKDHSKYTRGNKFYYNPDMVESQIPPYLYNYKGVHPIEIEETGLPQKEDFRI